MKDKIHIKFRLIKLSGKSFSFFTAHKWKQKSRSFHCWSSTIFNVVGIHSSMYLINWSSGHKIMSVFVKWILFRMSNQSETNKKIYSNRLAEQWPCSTEIFKVFHMPFFSPLPQWSRTQEWASQNTVHDPKLISYVFHITLYLTTVFNVSH